MRLCACGCGREIKAKLYHLNLHILPRYVQGHNSRLSGGKLVSEDFRKKLVQFNKNRVSPMKGKSNPGVSLSLRGRTLFEATRKKLSLSLRGKIKSAEHRKKIGLAHVGEISPMRGISRTPITREKIKRGLQKSYSYLDVYRKLFPENYFFYLTSEWNIIRFRILLRDNYTCQHCGAHMCRLDVHHKIPRLVSQNDNDENLITLCVRCHSKAENLYWNSELDSD